MVSQETTCFKETYFFDRDLRDDSKYTLHTTPQGMRRNLDLRVQVHPGELWVSKQQVHIVLEASKSAGAKGEVPKICGFLHPLHTC